MRRRNQSTNRTLAVALRRIAFGMGIGLVALLLAACPNPAGTNDDSVGAEVEITDSEPANGATGASIAFGLSVQFSEAMDESTLEGNVTIATDAGDSAEADGLSYDTGTRTLSFIVPDSLRNPEMIRLRPSTMYTVSVASSAQTADGNPLAQELSYSFTTFDYSELVDDTTFTDGELFGIAYHPGTDSIYFDGANDAQDDFFIRRYDVASGVVGTVAPPDVSFQVMYGGVDVYGDTLYLNKTYDGEVAEYDIQSDGSLVANGTTYASPTLSAPADDLSNVADTAVLGDTRYFVTSQYAGTPFTDIIAYNSPGDSWSVFADATTHGFDSGTRRAITAVDGTSFDYVYLFDNESSTLFRFAVGGGSFSTDVGISVSDVDLDHDSDGNIYVGTSVGLYQFSPDLALLEVREWAPASRITIKEIGDTVRVFLAYAGAPARIWYTDF